MHYLDKMIPFEFDYVAGFFINKVGIKHCYLNQFLIFNNGCVSKGLLICIKRYIHYLYNTAYNDSNWVDDSNWTLYPSSILTKYNLHS